MNSTLILKRMIAVFWLSLVLASGTLPSRAADIAIVGDTILFSGEIKAGDLSDLTKQVFKELALKPRQLTLSLNSNGNNFEEGVLLSLFVQQNNIRTLVKNGNRCNSACGLVFLGGASNEGGETDVLADRNLEVGAELGFHMPFTAAQQPAANAQADNLNVTEAAVQLTRLFDKLEVPPAIRPKLMQQDAGHTLYDATTVEAVELLQINVEGLTVTPSHITRSMAFNGCLNGYRLAKRQVPSEFAVADFAALNILQSSMPASRIANGEDEFVLVPSTYGGGNEVLICRIGVEGECQGFYNQDAMAENTIGSAQREDLSDCQRQSNVSILVPPTTTLREVDGSLLAMQTAEPTLLATKPMPVKQSSARQLNEEEVATNGGDVSEADAQPIPDIPTDVIEPPAKRFVVVAVQQRQEVICNAVQSFANVRAGPSGKLFPIVSTLPNQTTVTVLGNTKNPASNHPWYEISYAGGRGFVDSELVQRSCLVAMAATVPAVVDVPPPAPDLRSVVVCNPKGGDSVNVRSAPHPKNSQIIRKMFNQEKLTIIGEANNPDSGQLYFLVEADGLRGYVDNEFVSTRCNVNPAAFVAAPALDGVICNADAAFVNLRMGPNKDMFDVVAQVFNNQPLRILERTSNPVSGHPWLKVDVNGTVGFVDAEKVANGC
jgi:uncharacterized protein YgiM (DUF1202 family)